jgi:ABC-type multidrug transport system fused ATPase/permease subunit
MGQEELVSLPGDGELWQALADVGLLATVAALPGGLDYVLKSPQDVFSLGQRQLLQLSRALVRKNRVIMLDECTASVDAQTDNLVQALVHRAFKDCTVITIAHRISTVLDYDSVVVMRFGRVIEVGHPKTLLRTEGTKFRALALGEKS